MIDKRQLRIGNILSANSIPVTIKEIGEFEASIEGDEGLYTYDQLDGVELTPELLEACGFENGCLVKEINDRWFVGFEQDGVYLQVEHDRKDGISVCERICFTTIKYLHQLQNFFALTGTELTVNLDKVKV